MFQKLPVSSIRHYMVWILYYIFLSTFTGRLVVELIKVSEQYIQWLDINVPIIVDGVEVTALDANQYVCSFIISFPFHYYFILFAYFFTSLVLSCPGAVMFLFKLKSGKCILHTGDFRASAEMEEYPEFWNNNIDSIYLDTTYLSSRYAFFTQSDSISVILQYCRDFIKSSTSSSGKHLIICGAYKIGKEKVWLRIAQDFNLKVWIDDERHKVMQCIENDEINAVLTRHAKDANIHVLPLGSISYQVRRGKIAFITVCRFFVSIDFHFFFNKNPFRCSLLSNMYSNLEKHFQKYWQFVQVDGKRNQQNRISPTASTSWEFNIPSIQVTMR